MDQIISNDGQLLWDSFQVSQLADEYITIIEAGKMRHYDLLEIYKSAITDNDFIKAAAIDLALRGSNYKVADTHLHIPTINQNPWKDLRRLREKEGFQGTYLDMPWIKKYSWDSIQLRILKIY